MPVRLSHQAYDSRDRVRQRRVGRLPVALVAGMLATALTDGAQAQTPANGQNLTQQAAREAAIPLPSLAPLVDRVLPAVVNVSVRLSPEAASQIATQEGNSDQGDDQGNDQGEDPGGPQGLPPGMQQGTPFDQLLRRFFGQGGMGRLPGLPGQPGGQQGRREIRALGSGFIIDPAGYVVTNNHVVAHADEVTVIFQDNSRHPAKVLGRDDKTDLALLKIDAPKPLPFVEWGDSDHAKVGDWVVAVGNPFGLGGTVTAGIISARGRDISEGPYDDFLQIDAPINRGNSGGPTFNTSGAVIGINTAIFSPSGGSVGIGFAIPSDIAKTIVGQIKEKGHVDRGWLGVSIQNISPAIAKSLGLDPNDPKGALVASVAPNSPAAQAGIQPGDVITAVDGHPIASTHDLPRLVASSPVGQKLNLTIQRHGKPQEIAATVAPMPAEMQTASTGQPGGAGPAQPSPSAALGMKLAPLTAELRRRLHVPRQTDGVVIEDIADDSPAAALGLQPGDVIVSVDQQPVKSPQDAVKKLRQAADSGQALLLINRGGNSQFVGLTLDNNTNSGGGGSGGTGGAGTGNPG